MERERERERERDYQELIVIVCDLKSGWLGARLDVEALMSTRG
jgi:hypothetical protein